ncbi:MAG: hypothetical protein AB1446_06345 [Bacillota bacterium]
MGETPRPPRREGEDKAGDPRQDPQLQAEIYEEQASRQPQLIPLLFAWTQPDEIRDRSHYLSRLVRGKAVREKGGISPGEANPR